MYRIKSEKFISGNFMRHYWLIHESKMKKRKNDFTVYKYFYYIKFISTIFF